MTPRSDAPRPDARPDAPPDADEAALASFFAAARAADEGPRTALLSAILADAAEVHAARSAAPAPRRPGRRLARLLDPLGGWRGLATLGACALFGFWLGIAGNLTVDGVTLTTTAASQAAVDGVDAFFDYASLDD